MEVMLQTSPPASLRIPEILLDAQGGFRRLAIRYERLASTFLGFVRLACSIIHRGKVLK
jgi:hypothetical protein